MTKAQLSGSLAGGRRRGPVIGYAICCMLAVPVVIITFSLINFPSIGPYVSKKSIKRLGEAAVADPSEGVSESVFQMEDEEEDGGVEEAAVGATAKRSDKKQEREDDVDLDESGTDSRKQKALRVYLYDLPAEFNWNISKQRKVPVSDPRDLEWDPRDFSRRRLLSHMELGDNNVLVDASVSRNRHLLGAIDSISFGNIPVYEGGPQTRSHSVEFWLTLSLLHGVSSAVRVKDPSKADVFFVPFFSSISFNRYMEKKPSNKEDPIGEKDRKLQERLVRFLKSRKAWEKSNGRDHVIMAHHPKALIAAAPELRNAIFIVSDFQQFPLEVSNVTKDVVAPYKSPLIPFDDDNGGWDDRSTLIFFMGSVKRHKGGWVRQRLATLLPGLEDCVFQDQRPTWSSVGLALQGMRNSKFCLVPAGDTPSSARLFDAILSHCVPVIISDFLELPYEDVLDYSQFCVILPSVVAAQQSVVASGPGYLVDYLRKFPQKKWETMYKRLKEVKRHFVYGHPAQPNGAEDMIWQAVARKARGTWSNGIREKRMKQFAADLKASGLDVERKRRGKWQNRLQRLTEKERRQRDAGKGDTDEADQ